MTTDIYSIKANSSIIHLLGDELIGSDILAIFELVKNAYDADAEYVEVRFDIDDGKRMIVIEDDGCGMSPEIINNVWLTIGTDYKKEEGRITKRFGRHTLGNKGVGRLAVHKLADEITLETQVSDSKLGSRMELNWNNLVLSSQRIQDLKVKVENETEVHFKKGHGTRIILTSLKTTEWMKSDIIDIVRKVYNIANPFYAFKDFEIRVDSNNSYIREWINSVISPKELLNHSLFHYTFKIERNDNESLSEFAEQNANEPASFNWYYQFRPINLPGLETRIQAREKDILQVNWKDIDKASLQKTLSNKNLDKIGTIEGQFFAFNLNTTIINATIGAGRKRSTSDYLNQNSGVRIFRNNMRIFNYGEPTDDWLGIDMSKMRKVSEHFSKKSIVGFVSLQIEGSEGLVEKTNREGFIDSTTYDIFKMIVKGIFDHFERCATDDRADLEAYLSNTKVVKRPGMSESLRELIERLQEKQLFGEFKPLVGRIERDYNKMREVMLNSGMAGVNLSLVFHEVERGVRLVNKYLETGKIDVNTIKIKIGQLHRILEDFSPLLKQNNRNEVSMAELVLKSISLNQNRFNVHNIKVEERLMEDFHFKGPTNLLLSSFSNIIDNAIYWMDYKEEIIARRDNYNKGLFVAIDMRSFDGPAILFVDNGNGFELNPEELVQPYKTLKPDGMGLGLYYVDLVMQSIGGKLLFPDVTNYDIPENYSGAFIVLVFPNKK